MLTKAQIVEHIATEQNITKSAAERIYNCFTQLVTDTLTAGEEVRLNGVGTLKVATRAARTVRNPNTGQPLEIAEARTVKFTVTKDLKDALN